MKKETAVIARELERLYPGTRTALRFSTPFELLVATILSAQTTDRTVNAVTPGLFRQFRTPADFASASPEDVEKAVASVNFFRTKARNIRAAAEVIVREHGGKVPDSMDELVRLPGVARKTANVVLSQAFGKTEGVVVDTHVRRLAHRIGLTRRTDPAKVERDLMRELDRSLWTPFSFRLILHGRAVCTARAPACAACTLASLCAFARAARTKKNK